MQELLLLLIFMSTLQIRLEDEKLMLKMLYMAHYMYLDHFH